MHASAADAIQTGPADQRCDAKTGLAALLHKCEDGRLDAGNSLATVQAPKSLETRRRSHANARRKRIEHDPAANRDGWRVGAENESIAPSQNGRRFETKPDIRRSAGRHLDERALLSTCCSDRHTTKQFRRALMEADARSVAQRSCLAQQFDDGIEPLRGLERSLGAQRVAASEVADLHTAQIDRHTMSRAGLGLAVAMHLQSAYLHHALARQHDQLGLVTDGPRHQGPRHDRAKPFDREHPIDRQANLSIPIARAHRCRKINQRLAQLVEPFTRPG